MAEGDRAQGTGAQTQGGTGTTTAPGQERRHGERRQPERRHEDRRQQGAVDAQDAKRIEEAHRVKTPTMDDVRRIPPEEEGVPVAAGSGHGPIIERRRGKAEVKEGDTESNA